MLDRAIYSGRHEIRPSSLRPHLREVHDQHVEDQFGQGEFSDEAPKQLPIARLFFVCRMSLTKTGWSARSACHDIHSVMSEAHTGRWWQARTLTTCRHRARPCACAMPRARRAACKRWWTAAAAIAADPAALPVLELRQQADRLGGDGARRDRDATGRCILPAAPPAVRLRGHPPEPVRPELVS